VAYVLYIKSIEIYINQQDEPIKIVGRDAQWISSDLRCEYKDEIEIGGETISKSNITKILIDTDPKPYEKLRKYEELEEVYDSVKEEVVYQVLKQNGLTDLDKGWDCSIWAENEWELDDKEEELVIGEDYRDCDFLEYKPLKTNKYDTIKLAKKNVFDRGRARSKKI